MTGPNRVAVDELFRDHADAVYRLGLRICDDPASAEDLVQETFRRALAAWDGFEGRSKPSTWLYRIAARACQRMERRRAGEPRRFHPLDPRDVVEPGSVLELSTDSVSPLEWTERRERIDALRREIRALPLDFRLPIVLKEIEGLSIQEVADILGVESGTVKTRLHRARMRLRQGVEAHAGQAGPPPSPTGECLDLLRAKQEAMDRGVDFPLPAQHVCERCRLVFASLEGVGEICRSFSGERMPAAVRELLERQLAKDAD